MLGIFMIFDEQQYTAVFQTISTQRKTIYYYVPVMTINPPPTFILTMRGHDKPVELIDKRKSQI